MDSIHIWIRENQIKRPNCTQEEFRKIGYKIENAIPPVFEAYALIYHPYKIPKGEIITEKQEQAVEKDRLIKKINNLVERETGIPFVELPLEEYDIEEVVRKKLRLQNIEDHVINKKLEVLDKEFIKIIFEPFQDIIDSLEEDYVKEKIELREISWKELYSFYGIKLNSRASWGTIGQQVKSEDRIVGQEIPEMDYIPKEIVEKIHDFIMKMNVKKVVTNAQPKEIMTDKLKTQKNVTIISSVEKEWLFMCPYDFCRTIVAGKIEFVQQIINSKLFETSCIVPQNHRLDFYA